MLLAIKNKYASKNILCFLHSTLNLTFNTLHFHIIPLDNYKRKYPKFNYGQFMTQDMFIDEIINNLNANSNYYLNLDYNLIKS